MSNRDKMVEKVRALLAKTIDNGCTEDEAMSAFDVASRMMDEYEITEDDLKLEGETAIIGESVVKDTQAIRWKLCYAVSKFTETYGFGNRYVVKYAGLKSDVDFAIWLTEALAAFVKAELKSYMWANGYQSLQGNMRHKVINSFVIGCCTRINSRLMALVRARKVTEMSNALIVSKQGLIDQAIAGCNIKDVEKRGRKNKIIGEAYVAGDKAGNKATFGRPVSGGGMLRIG